MLSMQTVVKSLFLTVILYLMLEQAASEAKPDPQFQFGPFVFHPIKRGPRPSYFHHQQRQYRPRRKHTLRSHIRLKKPSPRYGFICSDVKNKMIAKKKCRFTRTGRNLDPSFRSFPDSSETGILINEEPFFVQSEEMKLPIKKDWKMNIEPSLRSFQDSSEFGILVNEDPVFIESEDFSLHNRRDMGTIDEKESTGIFYEHSDPGIFNSFYKDIDFPVFDEDW